MMLDLAGLLAAAALLITLIALEVRRAGPATAGPATAGPATAGPDRAGPDKAGPDAGRPTRGRRLFGRTVGRGVLAVMWMMYVFLFVPRVLGLLA